MKGKLKNLLMIEIIYSKSDYEITCENHKKNEIVDKIISILKNEN